MTIAKKFTVAAVVALTAISSYAFAANYIVETIYYSDASRSTIVGESVKRCNGSTFVTGQITSYSRVVAKYPCN